MRFGQAGSKILNAPEVKIDTLIINVVLGVKSLNKFRTNFAPNKLREISW